MDFKDIILIVGGLLIVAVVLHGFWIAWRARRDPLRMDLISESSIEDVDEMLRLRAELPNGGARVIGRRAEQPQQADLPLAGADAPRQASMGRGRPDGGAASRPSDSDARARGGRTEPRLQQPVAEPVGESPAAESPAARQGAEARADGAATAAAASRNAQRARASRPGGSKTAPSTEPEAVAPAVAAPSAAAEPEPSLQPPQPSQPLQPSQPRQSLQPSAQAAAARGKVADVIMPERAGKRAAAEAPAARAAEGSMARQAARKFNDFVDRAGGRGGEEGNRGSGRPAPKKRHGAMDSRSESRNAEPPIEEIIMISVLAGKGEPFVGGGLVEALRSRGLRYGDMNIFHRVDPMTRATLYSVANVVEPGTFDMADLEQFRSPGVCFFMQLPGPEHPMEAFEDMLKVARDVATRAGGELRDEQRSVMTGQTVEHYRQRISDFCRRRMSMRA